MLTKKQINHIKQMCEQSTYSLKVPQSNIENSDFRIRRMVSKLLELGFDSIDV